MAEHELAAVPGQRRNRWVHAGAANTPWPLFSVLARFPDQYPSGVNLCIKSIARSDERFGDRKRRPSPSVGTATGSIWADLDDPCARNFYEAGASGDLPGLIAALRPTTNIDTLHGEPPYGKPLLCTFPSKIATYHIVGVPQALGSNIKTRGSPDSFTALHFAAIRANLGAVHLLLGSGADHNARYEIWGGDGDRRHSWSLYGPIGC